MNFILYIKCVAEQDFSFSTPFYDKLKAQITTADFLDLDNFSEPYLIEQAVKAIETSEKSSILFSIVEGSNTVQFLNLATYLADHPEKCRVFVNGKDSIISKILFEQEEFCWHELEEKEIVKRIEGYL